MHTLDGSDAGGQFLRRALTLSALTGEPVRLESVRGNRPDPGLATQHLAVLETMATICDADVSGAELEAETVTFDPGLAGAIPGGEYTVEVGTAASLTLLIDSLLPLTHRLEAPLTLTATGGTDVAWSPPLDYLRYVKLPLLRRHGLQASLEVDRRGFYPAGGGRLRLQLAPSAFDPLELDRRGRIAGVRVYSTCAASLADADVGRRQAGGALERLRSGLQGRPALEDDDENRSLEVIERIETVAESHCPGSVIVLGLAFEREAQQDGTGTDWPLAGFSALGEPGKPAERVGEDAADEALAFLESDGTVDRYLADQLLDHLTLAGGRIRVPTVTDHVETSTRLLESFGVDLEREADGKTTVVSTRGLGLT
ncbi:RNA 3'-terminal phosphate cyclase [Natronosalvus vescus]|uniref:RNA 3'-terminal phosphate cyclase n=1 Tax=Natronosalvus vescus TaxID=2953881 RepID=UPI0020917D94|nr:RNA 3'-terminal phosphate cyclase [Natronosalvus vescus]